MKTETLTQAISNVQKYCTSILNCESCSKYPFHNLEHTQEVVANVRHIGAQLHLSNEELLILDTAAWFHDTGFSKTYKGHEDASKELAREFLVAHTIEGNILQAILGCIEATKMPQNPQTELERVICDSDLYHIATPDFFYKKLLLRREWEVFCDIHVSDFEWHKLNLDFLKNHAFWTSYAKEHLENGKSKNLTKVEKILSYYTI